MTRAALLCWRGYMLAAAGAAGLSRQARRAGDLAEYRRRSVEAADWYLRARLERGDSAALVEQAERLLSDFERKETHERLVLAQMQQEVEDAYLIAELNRDRERCLHGALPRGQRPKWARQIQQAARAS